MTRGAAWTAGGVAVYVALCAATAAVWEPAHDEGVTWDQAFGPAVLPSHPAPPAAAAELVALLDGAAGHGAAAVIEGLTGPGDMHPPAYYLAMNGLARSFGTSRAAVAWPLWAAGIASLLLLARLGERLIPGRRGGRWALALLAVSPWMVAYSVFARPYGFVLCLALAATVAALECARPGARPGWRIAFVAASTLGLYTLYHYAFVLVWHGGFLTLAARRRGGAERTRELARLAAMAGAIALLFAPWLPRLESHLALIDSGSFYFTGTVAPSEWPARTASLLRHFALGEQASQPLAVAAWAVLFAGTAGLALWSLRPRALRELDPDARALWSTAPLWLAAIACADLWQGSHTIFVSKTTFALLPLGILLGVRAWSSPPLPGWATRVGLASWALLLALTSILNVAERASHETPFERAARHLAAHDAPGHWVVVSSNRRGYAVPLLLSLRDVGIERVRLVRSDADSLAAVVDAAARTDGVRDLTLLNLAVPYGEGESWPPERIREARSRAEAAGFVAGALVDPQPLGERRRLTIAGGLRAKYFSR